MDELWSPYTYCGNNPIIFLDPDGRDIIIFNDPAGALTAGHNAILVGNDDNGWTFYSKNGWKEGNYDFVSFQTLDDYKDSDFSERYNEGIRFETSVEMDMKAQKYADKAVLEDYSLLNSNCADLTKETARAAGIDITNDTKLGITIPNMQMDQIKQLEDGSIIKNNVIENLNNNFSNSSVPADNTNVVTKDKVWD